MNDLNNATNAVSNEQFKPATNIYESEIGYEIELAIPGFSKENVEITIENDKLKITGTRELMEAKKTFRSEYPHTKFERNFNLSKEIDQDNIKATFENGILLVTLSKREELKPRSIEINS